MVSAAVALRIVIAAGGAPTAALAAEAVPVQDAACRPMARPCFVTAMIVVRNHFLVPMWLDSVGVILSRERPAEFHRPFEPPLSIAPGGQAAMPDVYDLHAEARHELSLRYHAAGEAVGTRQARVQVDSAQPLTDVASAACTRCTGSSPEACRCATGDAGTRCSRVTDCEGVCLFDHFEEIPPPVCHPQPHRACSAWLPVGFRVGRCSALRAPIGCVDVLSPGDSDTKRILLPAVKARRCFDQAERVKDATGATGSSRRR